MNERAGGSEEGKDRRIKRKRSHYPLTAYNDFLSPEKTTPSYSSATPCPPCLHFDKKSSLRQVVWFTALFPYLVLVLLLIRGISLPGAGEGITYYLTPNFEAIKNVNVSPDQEAGAEVLTAVSQVWLDAATQVFFSLGPGFGVLLAFASYNKFHNNVYRDALLTATVNSATSFLAGFVIFSILGYMAHRKGVQVKDVAAEGPGLVFMVVPESISTLPASRFFSAMFFLCILTLGLDSSVRPSLSPNAIPFSRATSHDR